jgi:Mb-OB3b family methanobactin precursor
MVLKIAKRVIMSVIGRAGACCGSHCSHER